MGAVRAAGPPRCAAMNYSDSVSSSSWRPGRPVRADRRPGPAAAVRHPGRQPVPRAVAAGRADSPCGSGSACCGSRPTRGTRRPWARVLTRWSPTPRSRPREGGGRRHPARRPVHRARGLVPAQLPEGPDRVPSAGAAGQGPAVLRDQAPKGGLEYAVLMRPGGERLEEAWEPRHFAGLPAAPAAGQRRPRAGGPVGGRPGRVLAADGRAPAPIDGEPGRGHRPGPPGDNRRLVFDCEYGGLFFAYLRPPVPGDPNAEPVYLFAATVSQEAMNLKLADGHFELLLRALKGIDTNVRSPDRERPADARPAFTPPARILRSPLPGLPSIAAVLAQPRPPGDSIPPEAPAFRCLPAFGILACLADPASPSPSSSPAARPSPRRRRG